MLLSSIFIAASGAVAGLLGCIHMLYTFHGNKLHPRDPDVRDAMMADTPVLTRQTTVWRATMGFNASHSLGAMLFGAVIIILGLENRAYLNSSVALNTLLVAVPLVFVALAFKYWFSVPRNGVVAGTLLIAGSMAMRLAA